MSQSIRRIEAELGVPLFARDRTKVVPTTAALQIAKEGMPLVGKVEALTQSIINQGLMRLIMCVLDYLNSMVTICWEKH